MGLLFPGQGSQFVGMGQKLYQDFSIAKETFAEANEVLGFDLQKLCFAGDLKELTKTENAQPAILTVSLAAFRAFQEATGFVPQFAAGHSLGEYSALVSAGAIKFADGLRIVKKRGEYMQRAVPIGIGTMMAVMNSNYEMIREICQEVSNDQEKVVVANYNSNDQIVISGHHEAVRRAGEKLETEGAYIKELKVSAPFHSPFMQPAANLMEKELEKYECGKMKWPVISNVTALPYQTTDHLIKNLTDQIVKPVRWYESIKYLKNRDVNLMIELGPDIVLKKLVEKCDQEINVLKFTDRNELNLIKDDLPKEDLAGLVVKSMALIISTKNNNLDEEEYLNGVVQPYQKIAAIRNRLNEENREATLGETEEVLNLLKTALDTKKVPLEEKRERVDHILAITATSRLFEDYHY